MDKKTKKSEVNEALRNYPGAAIDNADKDKTNEALVRERTATLNNNRNGKL